MIDACKNSNNNDINNNKTICSSDNLTHAHIQLQTGAYKLKTS